MPDKIDEALQIWLHRDGDGDSVPTQSRGERDRTWHGWQHDGDDAMAGDLAGVALAELYHEILDEPERSDPASQTQTAIG